MREHKQLMDLARSAAEQAARYISHASVPTDPESWEVKGISDFVTRVDRESESVISDVLLSAEPESVVVGEELSPELRSADLLWIVDPLDGTVNYTHRYPAYAVSIAAVVHGSLAAGAIYNVARSECFTVASGYGAWNGSDRLSVTSHEEPEHALIGTGFPFRVPELLPEYLEQFSRILKATSGVRRAGSAALDLADVACGRLDGFWELQLAPWDVAAGTLLIREARGCVSDINGSQDVLRDGAIVAGNPSIHRWLLEVLGH